MLTKKLQEQRNINAETIASLQAVRQRLKLLRKMQGEVFASVEGMDERLEFEVDGLGIFTKKDVSLVAIARDWVMSRRPAILEEMKRCALEKENRRREKKNMKISHRAKASHCGRLATS